MIESIGSSEFGIGFVDEPEPILLAGLSDWLVSVVLLLFWPAFIRRSNSNFEYVVVKLIKLESDKEIYYDD